MKFKTIKHFNAPGCFHELIFSCYLKQPLFDCERTYRLFIETLSHARQKHNFGIIAYMIMPTHVPLLICPLIESYSISKILSGIKVSFSMRMTMLLKESTGASLGHFWQRGGGYDRNLTTGKAIRASIDYIHGNPVRRGLVSSIEDWPWSSARYYLGMKDYVLKMDNELLEGLV
jgi:putative transposase